MRDLSTLIAASVITAVACSSSTTTPPPAANDAGVDAGGGDSGSGDTGTAAMAPTWTDIYTNIIASRCAPCHTTADGQGVQFGKLDMTSKGTAWTQLVGAPTEGSACSGQGTRVVAGDPSASILYLKVNPDTAAPCGSKMPLGGPALPKAEADAIQAWIAAGALND